MNEALVVYIGLGFNSFPDYRVSRLVAKYGDQKAGEMIDKLYAIVDEMKGIKIDWKTHSLSSAEDFICAEMRKRHPALDQKALQALAWSFSYDWK